VSESVSKLGRHPQHHIQHGTSRAAFIVCLVFVACLCCPVGAERYEKLEIQRRVYSSYMHFSTQPYWHAIDGTKDIDSIAAEVCVKAEQVVSSVAASDAPVTTLWDNAPLQQSAKVAESTAVEGASSSSVTSRLQ